MIFYKKESCREPSERLHKRSHLENAAQVSVLFIGELGWEIIFTMPRSDNRYRIWTKRNQPRRFRTLDAAASFLKEEGGTGFLVKMEP